MTRVTRVRGFGAAAVAAATLAVGAAPMHAQGTEGDAGALLGAWELERETPRGTMTSVFTFAQDGDSVLVTVGQGETAVAIGRVEFDGATVSFPFDLRAMMAGMRNRAGGPPEAGQRRAPRAGVAGGPPRGEMPRPPRFTGTLQGDEIRGAFTGRMGEQALVHRRVGSGG